MPASKTAPPMGQTATEPVPAVLDMQSIMDAYKKLQAEIEDLKKVKEDPFVKVQRDDMVLTRAWAEEWFSRPCADTEWVYVGTDKVTLVLQADTKKYNKATDQHDPVPDCTLEFDRFKGPVPERFRKKYRFFCTADLATNDNVEISPEDLSKYNFPEGTRPRQGAHKFEHMHSRLMRMYTEHRQQTGNVMDLQGLMPLERLKVAFQADMEAEWKADEMRIANISRVKAVDAKHFVTGQFLDTGEFPAEEKVGAGV